jgi:hypothetical protein
MEDVAMQSEQRQDSPETRANALYWESEKSVNQIADELELSKGMLYGMIRPLRAELPCPGCASDMEYTNRTARERGLLTCPSCGREIERDAARVEWERAAAAAPDGKLVVTPRPAPAQPRAGILSDRRRDPVMVGAGLLLIAAGIWLFRGLNRR